MLDQLPGFDPMSLGVRKIENLIQRDSGMARRVEAIERELRKGKKRKYLITIA